MRRRRRQWSFDPQHAGWFALRAPRMLRRARKMDGLAPHRARKMDGLAPLNARGENGLALLGTRTKMWLVGFAAGPPVLLTLTADEDAIVL